MSESVVNISGLVLEDKGISPARCDTRLYQSRDCVTQTAPTLQIRLESDRLRQG